MGERTVLLPVKASAKVHSLNRYYRKVLFLFFFVVHEIQPHSVLVAILQPLSFRKFAEVIAQVFICCRDCKEMERSSCYTTLTTTKI